VEATRKRKRPPRETKAPSFLMYRRTIAEEIAKTIEEYLTTGSIPSERMSQTDRSNNRADIGIRSPSFILFPLHSVEKINIPKLASK